MALTVNVYEAKTRLSELLSLAESGEEVIVARNGRPVVRLDPVAAPAKRRLGFLKLDKPVPDSFFFDPLPEEELAFHEGGADTET